MMKVIFCLGLTLFSINLFAQTNNLTGHIHNDKGQAVSNIFVVVLNSNLSTVTDAKNDFYPQTFGVTFSVRL